MIRDSFFYRIKALYDFFYKQLLLFSTIIILLIFIEGCGHGPRKTFGGKQTMKRGETSKEDLREELSNFEDYAISVFRQISDEIDAVETDIKTKRTVLLQRSRVKMALHTMLGQDDPIISFLETWALITRLKNYLEDGEGSNLYGEYQHKAIDAAKILEADIERIGQGFLKEDIFQETRKEIKKFANNNPITGIYSNMIVYATETDPREPSAFEAVISIPMVPFKAMEGVDNTALAIQGLKGSADRFSDVVEGLPESARWQLLLALVEMQDIEMVKTLVDNVTIFSQSSAKIADASVNLPKDIREQISVLIEEIDTKQANLQNTLDKAQKTIATAEETLTRAKEAATAFQKTAIDVDKAATAWDKAAISTLEALVEFNKFKGDPNKKSSFKMQDIQLLAESVDRTVVEISKLVKSEEFAEYAIMPHQIINLITWRLAQLIILITALALGYRFIATRVMNKKS